MFKEGTSKWSHAPDHRCPQHPPFGREIGVFLVYPCLSFFHIQHRWRRLITVKEVADPETLFPKE
jgi:hypothetical protein